MIDAEVLVIGSGPAGVNSAWPLVHAGVSVVMIDADHVTLPILPNNTLDELRNTQDRIKHYLGDDLGGVLLHGDYSPKLVTPLGRAILSDASTPGPRIRLDNFLATRTGASGGLSTIWGAFCSTYDSTELASFPISRTDMENAYFEVAKRIGISGEMDQMGGFHGSAIPLQKPVELSGLTSEFLKKYIASENNFDFKMGHARNAVITSDQDDRSKCNQCGLCLLGCARKSIYNSSYDLSTLKKYSNFRYVQGVDVERLVKIGNYKQEVETIHHGKICAKYLILAAGTINSTALILDYKKYFDKKVRLLSNPVAAMAFVVPKYIGKNLPSNGFSLGQLSYKLNIDNDKEYATGVIYSADTLPLDVFARRIPFTRPMSLRLSSMLAPSIMLVTCYLPGKYSDNSLRLKVKDGEIEVVLEGNNSSKAVEKLKYVGKRLRSLFRLYGAYYLPGSFTISPPGSDAHIVGTIPMGEEGELSCSDKCELNNAEGVYIVDGSWFPELPAKHCTFTIMANAYRVGRILSEQIKDMPNIIK